MSKVYSPLRITAGVLILLVCLSVHAQDWHIVSRDLFAKSVFAHGYMHGYEQGFHNGDLDLQLGRLFRDVKGQTEYKKPTGYRSEFGDKKDFEDGYRTGFLVGYTDCFAGRNFRAVQLLNMPRNSAAPDSNLRFDRKFDGAFRNGYEAGQRQGLADGRISDVSRLDLAACGPANGHEPFAGECDAFRDGYQLGYSDGFANQREAGESVARNRGETK